MFKEFPKIPRWSKDIVITEKIDGTNGIVYICENDARLEEEKGFPVWGNADFMIFAGSRTRWLGLSSKDDNFGFARWVEAHSEELLKLGPGHHYGEWWGKGIQRGYGLEEKRFSLFNVGRWNEENKPKCCHLVPILYCGPASIYDSDQGAYHDYVLETHLQLRSGSRAAPGYDNPEGIIVYHTGSGQYYKKTLEKDNGKWSNQA